jgi:hypothetical protein
MSTEAPTKKGSKPIATVREKGCAISVYKNVTKKDGKETPFYKFTLARTYKKGDEFATSYSFGLRDLATLKGLIDQARESVAEDKGEANAEAQGE